METYYPSYSSSSTTREAARPTQSLDSSLHSVRKRSAKPWNKKPLPRTQPRVYKVDPIDFRDLVQRLTGPPAPQPQPQRRQSLAPTPLKMEDAGTPYASLDLFLPPLDVKAPELQESGATAAPMNAFGFDLSSPSSLGWCPLPVLSPRSLSGLEQRTVS